MIIIEHTRRKTREAAEAFRAALIEMDEWFQRYDIIVTDLPADEAYEVIKDGQTFVVALRDPSMT